MTNQEAMKLSLEAYCKTLHPLWNTGISRKEAEGFFNAGFKAAEALAKQEQDEKRKLLPRCFADYQPNHTHDRKCEWCAVNTECQTGEQPKQEQGEPVGQVIERNGEFSAELFPLAELRHMDRLYANPHQNECTRSHPHEEMSKECELRTEIARLTNKLANIKQEQRSDSEQLGEQEQCAAVMPCGTVVLNVYQAYEAGKKSALSKQEQDKPVAWAMFHDNGHFIDAIHPDEHARIEGEYTHPLYTQSPQQRTWVGLTEEDFVCVHQLCDTPIQAAEYVNHLLKEKNT